MERATEQHFYHHGKEGREDEKYNCHWCQIRSFPTHKTSPITVVNEVNTEILKDFRFIDSNVLGHGVKPAEVSFRSGCACNHDDECQFTGCLCLADLEDEENDDDDDGDDGMDLNGPRTSRKAYAYHTRGSKAGLLRSRLLDSKVPIYECHQGCACSVNCPNRVVERGRTIPLQIFRTPDRGWGVRSPDYIKKGQFVDRYLGEIITSEEADRRRSASTISQKKDVYLFALDKFTDPDSLDPRLKGPPLEVDGEFMSGPTRFINHSCDPNMRIFARVGDHADKHIHDLALFAIKDIPKGEELTFDYVAGVAYEGEEPEGDDVGHMTPYKQWSQNGFLVKEYYEKFAISMVDELFPELSTMSAKIRKRQAITSFIVSPPIKAALGKFLRSFEDRRFQSRNDGVQTELVNIRPVFHDLMFGEKTPAKIKTAHLYIRPGTTETDKTWTLRDFILQFLVTAEIWRSCKTCRSAEWSMGSSEAVADFMTTMFWHYWVMHTEGCLDARVSSKEHQLDIFWNDWLEKYPVIGGQDEDGSGEAFVIRDEVEGTEETVLETVGYLGALGSCDESYKPARQNQASGGGRLIAGVFG
ncbi:hypothetical protein QQZ08_012119 [Neonectria magnoliae]|uniref:SET domain-containing protein n=1 Tax=Neonectria magnoliae TaxID=2732573 RepID=A0ABR1H4W8_9HYPO